MSEIELKACPFCGEKPISGDWPESGAYQGTGLAIECSSNLSKCPVNPAYSGYDRQAAIERWNTRAPHWQPLPEPPNVP